MISAVCILIGCSATTTSSKNEIKLPFIESDKGDCHRITTNVANSDINGECIRSGINVVASFGANLGVSNIDDLSCEIIGPGTKGTFKPPAKLLVPHPKESAEPILITCSTGGFSGSTQQFPQKVQPESLGYLFTKQHMNIVIQ